jgi:hypothetical protein
MLTASCTAETSVGKLSKRNPSARCYIARQAALNKKLQVRRRLNRGWTKPELNDHALHCVSLMQSC